MDWFEATGVYHRYTFTHDNRLSSLPEEWQRELAALWRLEADVNNGAYLQFLSNWGRESYVYASRALKKIGAAKMAEIVDGCQSLVDEHFPLENSSRGQMRPLSPNRVIGPDGKVIKEAGSPLPNSVIEQIYELSYNFMDYPDDVATLGMNHYRPHIETDAIYLEGMKLELDRKKREAEKDAAITNRRCPQCDSPCPEYRKTCKACGFEIGRAI